MLHELLFSLLGFTGDVIIDDGATFRVKDGFDLLRESEKDLVNRISPLGWYYVHLSDAVQRYDMNWTNVTRKRVYMAAAVQGIADLLAEYVADVAYMEQLVLTDGPMPLSQVQQHMQKVLLLLPCCFSSIMLTGTFCDCSICWYYPSYTKCWWRWKSLGRMVADYSTISALTTPAYPC